jgi:hypothetical protein
LVLKLEPLLRVKGKENQSQGGGGGKAGCQKSDKPVDTKKELARTAGVSHDTIAKGKVIESRVSEERQGTGARLPLKQAGEERLQA